MENDSTAGQLALPFHQSEDSLKRFLEDRLNTPVTLLLTVNSTSMLSARMHDGVLRIRLHRMFLHADSSVLHEIASYLKNKRGAMPHFRSFIRDNKDQLNRKPPKKIVVKTAGKFHDLSGLYDEINREYFGGLVNAVITWGTTSPRYAVRKRTLGSYSETIKEERKGPMSIIENTIDSGLRFLGLTDLSVKAEAIESAFVQQQRLAKYT